MIGYLDGTPLFDAPTYEHQFDPSLWKEVSRTANYECYYLESYTKESKDVVVQEGEDVAFVNTCTECGDLITRYIRT